MLHLIGIYMALALDEADEAKVIVANVDEGLAIRRQYLRLTMRGHRTTFPSPNIHASTILHPSHG